MAVRDGVMTRGTTNRNARGGSVERLRRRLWLVQTFRADVDARMIYGLFPTDPVVVFGVPLGEGVPACRCYRCGALLTVETVSADRIVPGCQGGRYTRNNIRPCCGRCNSITGGSTRSDKAKARRKDVRAKKAGGPVRRARADREPGEDQRQRVLAGEVRLRKPGPSPTGSTGQDPIVWQGGSSSPLPGATFVPAHSHPAGGAAWTGPRCWPVRELWY